MRILLAVIVGAVVAFACIMGIEFVGHAVYPPPPDIDLNDPEQAARYLGTAPAAVLGFVAAAWFVGALAGAWVATAIARRAIAGWIVALLVLAGCIAILILLPGHPGWMWAAAVLLPLIGGWLAQRLAKPPA